MTLAVPLRIVGWAFAAIVAVHSAPSARADALVGRQELAAIAAVVGTKDCRTPCESAEWIVRPAAFPAGYTSPQGVSEQLFLATATPPQCGAGRCPSAYILRDVTHFTVIKDGWNLGQTTRLAANEVPRGAARERLVRVTYAAAAAPVAAASPEANRLFSEAAQLHSRAIAASGAEQITLYRQVLALLDRIVAEHPQSMPAQRIRAGGSLGRMDVGAMRQAAAAGPVRSLRYPVATQTPASGGGFYDPEYPSALSPPAQHLGVDLAAPAGTDVVTPVTGVVVTNRTAVADAFNKYLVIRDAETGFEHVLGHIESALAEGASVHAGDSVGKIVTAGTGPHVHWGVNTRGVQAAMDVPAGWGWGRAPLASTVEQAQARGWVDPLTLSGPSVPSAGARVAATPSASGAAIGQAAQQAATAPAPTAAAPAATETSRLTGTWSGQVSQPGFPQPYSVMMELNSLTAGQVCGRIRYPELACGGPIQCIEPNGAGYRLRESITEGRGRCDDQGIIEIERSGNLLNWTWRYSNGRVGATAVLAASARQPEQAARGAAAAQSRPAQPPATSASPTTAFHRDRLSTQRIVQDQDSGCRLRFAWDEVTSIKWEGACVDSFADGAGTISWYRGENLIWRTRVGPDHAMTLDKGYLQYNLNASDFDFSMTSCEPRGTYRSARIIPKSAALPRYPGTFFENTWVTRKLFDIAAQFAAASCPKPNDGYSNISVVLAIPNEGYGWGDAAVSGRNYDVQSLTWREWNNIPASQLDRRLREENQQVLAARRQALHEAQMRQIEMLRQQAEVRWIAEWDRILVSREPVGNVADLIRRDRSSVIQQFTAGRSVIVTYQNIMFRDGKVQFWDVHRPTNIYAEIPNPPFTWDAFLQATQNVRPRADVEVVCQMAPGDVGAMREGQRYRVQGKLISLTDQTIVLQCTSPASP
jgi:murein DD-endopeptidase MepM/ murein hydrolase activator NlpD